MTSTQDLAARLAPELIALRRKIHANPELALDNPVTQQTILDELAGLDLEITKGRKLSSVVAVLRGTAPGASGTDRPVVLLRGDMDGLPVVEQTGLDYASENGLMHACGHDLHVAGLVGAAKILHELRDQLPGDVVFMFQPGEEGPGGADPMVREGLLEAAGRRVDAAYALHVTSAGEAKDMWFGRPGPLMAAADEFFVTVRGRGGHGSQPHNSLDPVPVACEIVLAVQTMVTRKFNVFDPVVVTCGMIAAGSKDNIIPDDARLEMTVRTFSPDTNAKIKDELTSVANHVAAAHGMKAEIDYRRGYPVTVNDPDEYRFLTDVVTDLFGADHYTEMPFPEAGSEDFSFVANEVPSAFIFLSACTSDDPKTAPDNHSPRAAFDDSVVPDGAALLAETALRRLQKATAER
ncbi:M20 metallopeptidase family protein [Nakamurella aerolata]|uniref:Amidohydrolase n=1 Tax=Nakamurella aerolata TaxID=1656892 RepID=A0A849A5T4_9ACTN|nr:M20 family metallopeptidase [Nakamurella aerolata]NNG36344.1 amidohydrolase [Nakamurella aerolata]